MTPSDREYFYGRAEAELTQAQRATSAEAVRIHYTLAGHYLDRAYGGLPDDELESGLAVSQLAD